MVSGSYLAFQFRGAMPYFRVYADSILRDALSGFTNFEERADAVADQVFKNLGSRPGDPDGDDDMSREAEYAQEQGQAYYEAMVGLRQSIINLLAAGLFHLLEQQLAKITFDCKFDDIHLDPTDANLHGIAKWYGRYFGLDLKTLPAWDKIDELRLVANAVKHADGKSAKELREKREELFRSPTLDEMDLSTPDYDRWPLRRPLAGEDLFVTEAIFREYAEAVCDFAMSIMQYFRENAAEGFPLTA